MTYVIDSVYKRRGMPCTARPVMSQIVSGQAEMLWYTHPKDAETRVLRSIEESERLEVCCWLDKQLVGIAILRDDEDDHVGWCLSVQWRWVHPEHRAGTLGMTIQRTIIRTAKAVGHKALAYTKTLSPGRYELTYLPLEKRRGQEDQEGVQGR